jgi:AmmeMemoRadiSam system protein A
MNPEPLTKSDHDCLLQLARQVIAHRVTGRKLPALNPQDFSPRLRENGAVFVTLTEDGELRGCVGALEAYQPLFEDVCEHAEAAAFHDFRFPPLQEDELPFLHIEISYLTAPQPLEYADPVDLLSRLRPGTDGVLIRDGFRRATFLPQVWEKLPNPADFMDHLCQKMGAPENTWRRKPLQVFTYQVESFEEET